MFKVIKDFVAQPTFAMYCDASCGTCISAPFQVTPQLSEDMLQGAFIQETVRQGWKVTLDRQTCPAHVAKAKEAESLILIPKVGAAYPSRN